MALGFLSVKSPEKVCATIKVPCHSLYCRLSVTGVNRCSLLHETAPGRSVPNEGYTPGHGSSACDWTSGDSSNSRIWTSDISNTGIWTSGRLSSSPTWVDIWLVVPSMSWTPLSSVQLRQFLTSITALVWIILEIQRRRGIQVVTSVHPVRYLVGQLGLWG